jgi:hypothetical protein
MKPKLRPELDLDLPDGRGVDFPPPGLPLKSFFRWLQERHEARARHGNFDRYLADLTGARLMRPSASTE